MKVLVEKKENICTIQINRPIVRNAVDRETAQLLAEAFRDFENDENLHVAVLYGKGGTFCAGADLKAFSVDDGNCLDIDMSKDGPMGPSRMNLSKPVIAAVSGHAVAGGLELAIWCDLRVVEKDAIFGVFCRRFGVPLIDGGTQRLPRLIGMSRALDLILTGRSVGAEEALSMGLANRIVEVGTVKEEAEKLAAQIAQYPQLCMKNDRKAVYEGFDLDFEKAMQLEFTLGMTVVQSGESMKGAKRFVQEQGKHGMINNG
ncbi:crotonase/enoyl-CoA hydratase family protein [Gottfriedia acidiceleris]|uniref:crotonase/enoyl-CoA hydratase family protein n=1 Tax=Gottfriedia acidiceleris TaxID=371036 RepID=UPI00101CD020|nr:crotonase/enoyl-CoA hydratase family protein [Gottfriedia acidiceleris]